MFGSIWNQHFEHVRNYKLPLFFQKTPFLVLCFQPSLPNLLTMVSDFFRFRVRGERIERGAHCCYVTGILIGRPCSLGSSSWAQSWSPGPPWAPLPAVLTPEASHFLLTVLPSDPGFVGRSLQIYPILRVPLCFLVILRGLILNTSRWTHSVSY